MLKVIQNKKKLEVVGSHNGPWGLVVHVLNKDTDERKFIIINI